MKKLLLAIYLGLCLAVAYANQNTLTGSIQFASVEKATALLNTHDVYTDHWSQFDLNSRLHKQNGTSEEQFKNLTAQIRAWTPQEIQKVKSALEEIDESIAADQLDLPLPKEIYFVKSTMKDEAGADGYTRANCVVLKDDLTGLSEEKLHQVLVHEVFHVLSRLNPVFRKKMYGFIGFKMMNEVAYPPSIKDYKISNPDAPSSVSYITVKVNDKPVDVTMILYSKRPYTTGDFFEYVTIGFLKLKGNDNKEIDYENGQPVIYSMNDLDGFLEQIGKNTAYVLDPEEIMADNFAYTINHKTNLPFPSLIADISSALKIQ